MRTWSAKAMKYLLFVFNLVFVITGIGLISLGIAIKSTFQDYEMFLDNRYFSTPSILIVVGVFIFFVAFFGCCGAIKENYCMIFTFSLLLAAIFVTEIVAGITGYVLSDEASQVVQNKLNSSMSLYNKSLDTTLIWDEVQTDLQCCGCHNYTEWLDILNGSLPMSCCGPQTGAIGQLNCFPNTTTLYKASCLDVMANTISKNVSKIGFAGFSIALIQMVGILFACRLARNVKENYENV